MANFALPFIYNNNHQYILWDDMTSTLVAESIGSVFFFATNRDRNYYYCCESGILKRRSTIDGTLQQTAFEAVGSGQRPLFVDVDNFLWCLDNEASSTIRKWSADLQSRTDYVVDTSEIGGSIKNAAMTFDAEYWYLTGDYTTSHRYCARFATAELLAGNSAEWAVDVGHMYALYPVVDRAGNVIVSQYGGAGSYNQIRKLSKTNGSVLWSAWGNGYFAYKQNNDNIYIGNSITSGSLDEFLRQIDNNDGSILATTVDTNHDYGCVYIFENACYGGIWDNSHSRISKFNIQNDWEADEPVSGFLTLGENEHAFAGDPTGYFHEQLLLLITPVQTQGVLNELELRLEDSANKYFTELFLIKVLNQAQLKLIQLIDDSYLNELKVSDSALDASNGFIEMSALTYDVVRGGQGIIEVKLTIDGTEVYPTRIEIQDLDTVEDNPYLNGIDSNPKYYVFNDRIYLIFDTLAGATAEVSYLRMPADMTTELDSTLNKSLHPLIITLAESDCWVTDGKLTKGQKIKETALSEIIVLNKRSV